MNATPRSPDPAVWRDAIAHAVTPGIGCVAFRESVERFGSATAAFRAAPATGERARTLGRADELIARAQRAGAGILVFGESGYPEPLTDLSDPPSLLFTLGNPDLCSRPRVGIVGTRNSSSSGERIAHRIAGACARAGATIVSGMALGIDAAAHRGALDAAGGTVAVLGGGADLPYPPTHASLHERITRDGLVLSEAPLGARPVKGAFPRRNRIIAALSDLLIVIEAGHRSGALITAGQALELGRPVAAVPGPIDSPRHAGSNELLAAGAHFLASSEDALQLAGLPTKRAGAGVESDSPSSGDRGRDRTGKERAVYLAVQRGASETDGIARVTGLSAREIGEALSALEITGELRLDQSGQIVLAG